MSLAAAVLLTALVSVPVARAQSTASGLADIAFSSAGRIFVIDANGSDRRQVTGPGTLSRGGGRDSDPAWAPDGSTIAFARGSRIYLMRPDGSGQRPITQRGRGSLSGPQWSPDGQWIAYARAERTESKYKTSIIISRADGSEERTLAAERIGSSSKIPAFLSEPAWSPDGTRVLFTRTILRADDYHYHPSVYVVRRDGGGKRLLQRNASAAAWSPDGSWIAFASTRDRNGERCPGDLCSYNGEIYLMDAEGKQLNRLTNNEGHDYEPDWSADGTRLAFSSDRNYPRGESPELYSIEPDGDCLTWLTNGSPESAMPDWEPNQEASTDPGGCGATARPALVELDARPAERVEHDPVFWLGPQYEGMLLSDVHANRRRAFFRYGDCASYEPDHCGIAVQLQEEWACSRWSGRAFRAASFVHRFLKLRGALLGYFGWDSGLAAYTGPAQVDIFLDFFSPEGGGLEAHLQILRDLRRVGRSETGSGFQRPVLARHLVREIRRAGRLHRRLGNVRAVAREIGEDVIDTRSLIRSARVLRRLGPVGRITCPRRPR
jgi:Tol biopolymer transport system component